MTDRGLQVSVDSADNELASWLSGVDDYLDRAKSTTANLVAAGLNPRVKCVMTNYNWEEAERIVELFLSLGARRFQFVHYGRSLYRHSDDLFLTREQKLRLSEFLRLLADNDNGDGVHTIDKSASRAVCECSLLGQPIGSGSLAARKCGILVNSVAGLG